ncbi:protein adenylyltransferase SelO isoform X5 [Xenopus laevis]|uniref:Selenoprotein O n=1 Tax=Xenopus laevis TaxID=8355 RepID=A0A8J1KWW1_XENLA|nr:protein adenylyltransferase SelO isoform X5 [Xenopus laevis]XP_041421782.1 protein adenylyltransferase SelO isoform X5 [Xenopus laevis]
MNWIIATNTKYSSMIQDGSIHIYFWVMFYPFCIGWKATLLLDEGGSPALYMNHTSGTWGFSEKRMKVYSVDQWSLSPDDVLDELPIDPNRNNYVRRVHKCIFSCVSPTPFTSEVRLIAVSEDVLENLLDLAVSVGATDEFLQFVSGRDFTGWRPLAHRYGGHQFGVWAGQLGDGRAHLVGTYINRFGERWELQLKGSGRTPYSRDGDGRAVLRSSVREFLCSEAMHHLGIPTSRAASLVVSDDAVWRDQFYNGNLRKERGAMILRVAKSWFRIGSLEILARSGEFELLRNLADFIITNHFPSINSKDPNRTLAFFSIVVSETASLVALWMSVGFAHGVCNTDNFSLLSITIDYGPFGFMESYDADYVPNTSDDEGRYRIGNQANAAMFNLNKLRLALNPLLDARQQQLATQVLEGFPGLYYQRFTELFRSKLGMLGENDLDLTLISSFLDLMASAKADFTMSFRQLSEISLDELQSLTIPQEYWALQDISRQNNFPAWVDAYILRLKSDKPEIHIKKLDGGISSAQG